MGEIEIAYNHAVKLTEKEEMALEVLRGLLETRYFTELREKEGATYSVGVRADEDRKSTRLNSSHAHISYDAFCLTQQDIASRIWPVPVASGLGRAVFPALMSPDV